MPQFDYQEDLNEQENAGKAELTAFACERLTALTLLRQRRSYGRSS